MHFYGNFPELKMSSQIISDCHYSYLNPGLPTCLNVLKSWYTSVVTQSDLSLAACLVCILGMA